MDLPEAISYYFNVFALDLVGFGKSDKPASLDVKHTEDKGHRKKIAELHGFRKFFSTQLVNSRVNTEKRWLLEGHSLKNNDNSYVLPSTSRTIGRSHTDNKAIGVFKFNCYVIENVIVQMTD